MNYELHIDWKLNIDCELVLRAMGADPGIIRHRQARLVRLVESVVAKQSEYLQPRAAIREIAVRKEAQDRLLLAGGFALRGELLCRRLAGSERVVAAVATVGSEFERSAESTDPTQRLILDGVGTCAITSLTKSILDGIRKAAQGSGRGVTQAIHPGMKGWELAHGQAQIFALVDGAAAGVSLNESFMMTPRKSVSLLVGIGARVNETQNACEDCGAVAHCRHKPQLYAC
ncbi:MAG TPA: hypothetical protein VMH31_09250 [Methylomirabilota bacterium]|nr:hypothetical protein [Methylomirabilota bacterium]